MLRYSYKNYSSLNRWQANRVLLPVFTSYIYFLHLLSVTMHLQGKKVSILPLGDVNVRPTPLRQGLLEDSPYGAVGATCSSCDESRPRI
jgi:hypothetical protein